jgi:hypothetical protein
MWLLVYKKKCLMYLDSASTYSAHGSRASWSLPEISWEELEMMTQLFGNE